MSVTFFFKLRMIKYEQMLCQNQSNVSHEKSFEIKALFTPKIMSLSLIFILLTFSLYFIPTCF